MRSIRYWAKILGRVNTMQSLQPHQSGRTPNYSLKLQLPSIEEYLNLAKHPDAPYVADDAPSL